MLDEYDKPNKLDGFRSDGDAWVILANDTGVFRPLWVGKLGHAILLKNDKLVYVHWVEQRHAWFESFPQPV